MQTKKNRKSSSKKRRPKVIGKLYATWCGHCKTLEPEWDKMKTSVTKFYKNGVEFVEIESENMESDLDKLNQRLNTDIAVQSGYPTLFKVEPDNTKVEYYGGNREAKAMTEWCTGKKGGKRQKRKQTKKRQQKHR